MSDSQAQGFANAADDHPRRGLGEAHILQLSGGDAVAYDRQDDDGRWLVYLITNGERWLLLECGSRTPPDDGWRSIADTVEFLPDGA